MCDDALLLGRAALPEGVVIKQIDIVEDGDLMSKMASRIPVMQIESVELNWPFEKHDIQNAWKQRATKRRYLL